jgi:hypothetical protein
MDTGVILGLVSGAAALALILGHKGQSDRMKMLLGGVAVATAIVAVSLLFDKT